MDKKQVSLASTLSNVLLAVLKLGVGFASGSSAIVASGIDSLSDILSSLLVYIGIKFSEKESSEKYPYGLYRAESIAGFVVFLFVIAASAGIIYESAQKLVEGSFQTEVSLIALLAMVISAVVSGIFSALKFRVGKAEKSTALLIDARHSLIDLLTSVGVLIGLVLSKWNPMFDGIVGVVIGLYILFTTLRMTRDVLDGLLDTADPDTEDKVRARCSRQEIEVSSLKTRKVAGKTFVEIEIVLPTDIQVKKADKMIVDLQQLIIEKIDDVQHVVVQIKGGTQRRQLTRGACVEKGTLSSIPDKLEKLEKKGVRTLYPYENGKVVSSFGAESYLIVDKKNDKVMFQKVVKNPYFRVGRSHGIRFARAVQADRLVAADIGDNAKKMLSDAGIEVI